MNDNNSIDINQERRDDDDIVATEDPFTKQIYRFKFSTEFVVELTRFSKLHQHDKRKDYKEAWTLWSKTNDTIIQNECNRLNMLGYYGNIQDKMYKSSRYYFRKNPRRRMNLESGGSIFHVNKTYSFQWTIIFQKTTKRLNLLLHQVMICSVKAIRRD